MRHVYQKALINDMLSGPVRVAGVSYGGFLSVMVAALDSEHPDPIINQDATAVAPPYDMGITMIILIMPLIHARRFCRNRICK